MDFEKLGSFYLGKHYDPAANQPTNELLLYDAKDLTTHAVCVGMTGSGKTGLCISLLEEAAIDGIPAIIVDPKGDLGNLLLTFPDLKPSDFEPWLEASDAARKGLTIQQLAEKTAESWRKGLADWHQPIDRIARLKQAADVCIYTPGSTAGRPLTVLRSFDAPPAETLEDASALRDYTMSAVSGLLSLVGVGGDPLRSREHILLSSIMEHYWKQGQNLDIPALIHAIQKPPFAKVGVFDLDSFYPAKDRLELAMSLNNLIASPGFAVWTQGEPLDIQRLLYTPEGKPRLAILSIAHLADSERMFFVTILLNAVLAWMRTQSGTSSLRALLYMDEIFGYFPPTANPPSKPPMLTLLKQARAFGLGVVLATQNPVDLDYKGLANTGTWLIGRLQTERDKARVLDGLESASQGSGAGFERSEMDKLLSGLDNRVFLLHNVHQPHPVLFQTRWVMSFLRGPLTTAQIKTLSAVKEPVVEPALSALQQNVSSTVQNASPAAASSPAPVTAAKTRPSPPPGVDEYFVRPRQAGINVSSYHPAVIAQVRLHFVDAKTKTDCWRSVQFLHPAVEKSDTFAWKEADETVENLDNLDRQPAESATFDALPDGSSRPSDYKLWGKMLESHIYQETTLELFSCPELKLASKPGETEGDFKTRLQVTLREKRDGEMEKINKKYATRIAALEEQVRKAGMRVEKEKDQLGQQKMNTAISVGAALLGAFFGRRAAASNVGRAATAMKGFGKTGKEQRDIEMAGDSLAATQARLEAVQQELATELEAIKATCDVDSLTIETTEIRPRKTDISVTAFGLAWMPKA